MTDELSRRSILRFGGTALVGAAAVTVLPTGVSGLATPATADTVEPVTTPSEADLAKAQTWWTPARQVWTPIGWKGHLFRFNVFYNGDVICRPGTVLSAKNNVSAYNDEHFQLTVKMPGYPGDPLSFARPVWDQDTGWRQQSWLTDHDTPVLATEFRRQEGLVITETVFAHVPGATDLATGTEPIYAWVRFEVTHVDEVTAPDTFTFNLMLSKANVSIDGFYSNEFGVVAMRDPDLAQLPANALSMDRYYNPTGAPISLPIYDSDGTTRLVARTSLHGSVALNTDPNHADLYDLALTLPVKVGATVDLIVPMLPAAKADIMTEVGLGRDAVLSQTDAFWGPTASTVATISLPEDQLNQLLRRTPQLAQVVAELSRDPAQPKTPLRYSFLSGSYGYDVLWSTPTSMVSHMFLDLLGYHDVVEQHTVIYADMQGKQVPPGTIFGTNPHPGYLGTPSYLQAIDWMSDHGAVLEIVSRHALLTDDADYIAEWTDRIVQACDFIVWACGLGPHDGVQGLMPPGNATDEGIQTQGVNSQCFTYKGLASAVQFLQRQRHPRAGEFAMFAKGFRKIYNKALKDMAASAPTWMDSSGRKQPVLGPSFTDEAQPWLGMTRFDTGPLMSVWAGLTDASDPLMRSFLDFFRNGPDLALFDRAHHNGLDRVILEHEVGSGEPCYSWNLMHTWQLGDRERFVEGIYGLMTYALSQNTFVSCEHRSAMWGNLFAVPATVWSMRQSVVDDVIAPEELHLLRLIPAAWLDDQPTVFKNMPTVYGPVDITIKSGGGGDVDIRVSGHWHHRPRRVVVHLPSAAGIRRARVNGKNVVVATGTTKQVTL